MRWPTFRWTHRHLDERVKEAREETEKSRRALEDTRAHVITPLNEWRTRNHFADLIRDSLQHGGGDRA